MAPKYIKRVTLFKIPKEEDIATALHEYEILRDTATKDGKPYVLSNEAGRIINSSEQRAKGWTLCAQTAFASMEDLKYYDEVCEAHKKLKSVVTPLRDDVSVMLFESEVDPPPTPGAAHSK